MKLHYNLRFYLIVIGLALAAMLTLGYFYATNMGPPGLRVDGPPTLEKQEATRPQPEPSRRPLDTEPTFKEEEKLVVREEPNDLRLLGTILADSSEPIAVIEDLLINKQGYYRLGQEVKGFRLAEILLGKVTLEKGGQLYTLTTDYRLEDEPITVLSSTKRIVNTDLVSQEMKDINDVWEKVKIRPQLKGGRVAGYLISDLAEDELILKSGLKKGDIIQLVNGKRVGNLEETFESLQAIYRQLQENSEATLSLGLIRDDQPKNLIFQLRKD